jgi:hypothetical protein
MLELNKEAYGSVDNITALSKGMRSVDRGITNGVIGLPFSVVLGIRASVVDKSRGIPEKGIATIHCGVVVASGCGHVSDSSLRCELSRYQLSLEENNAYHVLVSGMVSCRHIYEG